MIVATVNSSIAEHLSWTNCGCLKIGSPYLHMLFCNFSCSVGYCIKKIMGHKCVFKKCVAGHFARVWAATEQLGCGESTALQSLQMKMICSGLLKQLQNKATCSALTAQGVCLFCQLPLLALPFIFTETCSASGSTLRKQPGLLFCYAECSANLLPSISHPNTKFPLRG